MKLKSTFAVCAITVMALYFIHGSSRPELELEKSKKEAIHLSRDVQLMMNDIFEIKRNPAQVISSPSSRSLKQKKDLLAELEIDEAVSDLPRGMVFVKNVKVIRKEEYHLDLGSSVHENQNMIFFKPNGQMEESWGNVVYDQRTKSLYPVSSVLKIGKVSEDLRSQLLAKGFQEYYYHGQLGLLFIQTTHQEVVQIYQTLKEQGLRVEFEVLKVFHRPR